MSKLTKAELQALLAAAQAEIEKLQREKDEMIAKKTNAEARIKVQEKLWAEMSGAWHAQKKIEQLERCEIEERVQAALAADREANGVGWQPEDGPICEGPEGPDEEWEHEEELDDAKEHVQDLLDRGVEPQEDHETAWKRTFEGRWETAREEGRALQFYLSLFGLRPEDYEGGPVTLAGKLDPAPKWVARIAASAWREGGKEALNALARDLVASNRVKVWWHKDHLEVSPKK